MLDTPEARRTMTGLLRAAASEEEAAERVRDLLMERLLGPLARHLGGDQPELRAALTAAQIAGLAFARHVVGVPRLVDASREELVAAIGPGARALPDGRSLARSRSSSDNPPVELAALVVAIVLVVILVSRVTPSGIPTPIALLVVGAVLSFVPGIPEVRLSSELVLYGLLPPLLYAAALSTSLLDVRAHRGAILSLSVGLVLFTAAGRGARRVADAAHLVRVGARPGRDRRTAGCRGRHRPWPAGSACPGGSRRSSRASRCSTTPPPWSPCAPRSRRRGSSSRTAWAGAPRTPRR